MYSTVYKLRNGADLIESGRQEQIPALVLNVSEVKKDPAFSQRGSRRVIVSDYRPQSETIVGQVIWSAPASDARCEVMLGDHFELATFNENAQQQRHFHKIATEVYIVLEGTMKIEVQGAVYSLNSGDTIVIRPGMSHLVLRDETHFVCRVLCVNCLGAADKYLDGFAELAG